MKLSKLYSNKPDIFGAITFNPGLNVIKAEIRLPENKNKDTHNLGKTTLGRLLDFCLLSRRDKKSFLFRNVDQFRGFVFFIEIQILNNTYVTVRRGVDVPSKISFLKHNQGRQDFSNLDSRRWDHWEVPFDRAKELLDSLLDLRYVKPWPYRKGLGYLLRSQDDFKDVFQLKKFSSKHSEWKPFLAHILGFRSDLIDEQYKKEEEIIEKNDQLKILRNELFGSMEDLSRIEGLLFLKQNELEKKQDILNTFDFRTQDIEKTKQLVDEIGQKIAQLNIQRYYLTKNLKTLSDSLEDQVIFNPDEAELLFREAGVYFQGQIKRNFDQLVDFNRSITEERKAYLLEEKKEMEDKLGVINSELESLGEKNLEMLSFLSSSDLFLKFKRISDEVISIKADITSLVRQRDSLQRIHELRREARLLSDEKVKIQSQVEKNIEEQHSNAKSLFSKIRLFFSEIVEKVISRKALLSVSINKEGHLEFNAEILDESGNSTQADMGHTYRKLLCIAFDLAVLRAHLHNKFPRFVFHDGVFESLDDRKKVNLFHVSQTYTNLGIQHIITLIDSDLPVKSKKDKPLFKNEDIVLLLHDEDETGRLFKMETW